MTFETHFPFSGNKLNPLSVSSSQVRVCVTVAGRGWLWLCLTGGSSGTSANNRVGLQTAEGHARNITTDAPSMVGRTGGCLCRRRRPEKHDMLRSICAARHCFHGLRPGWDLDVRSPSIAKGRLGVRRLNRRKTAISRGAFHPNVVRPQAVTSPAAVD